MRRTLNGVTTRYLYDGDDLAAEVDASGNRIRTYRYWPGIDQPHSMQSWEGGQNGTVHFYALDLPSTTVRGLFSAGGAVTQRYGYGPFGEPQGTSGSTSQPLRFAARELDATTGLYYVRARWYDPAMGRFISEDPIGLAGGVNNYAYAANDPVNLSDPTGLCVGQVYYAETTTCLLGGASTGYSPFNVNSMIDQAFGLSGRQSVFAGLFAHQDDGSGALKRYFGCRSHCMRDRTESALEPASATT